MLRHRQDTRDDPAVDDDRVVEENPVLADDGRARVDRGLGDDRHHVPDDPRQIRDDGTIDDNLIWAYQPSVSPTVEPVVPEAAPARRTFSWGQVLILLAGAASLVFGVGAVALAGLAGPVTEPIVRVFTFDHTPLLGLIEIGAGAVLLIAGLIPGGRWVAGPVGVAAIVGGALVLAELDWTQTELAAEQRFGWVPIAIGTAAYLGAMVPTKRRMTATR